MATTTYSFSDLVGSIHCPAFEDFVFTGEGVGSLTITKSQERTQHDVAADGSVMVSKIAGENGQLQISVQQSSPLHKWLEKWYQAVYAAGTGDWASTSVYLKNTYGGDAHLLTGVSPAKEADVPYQAQGQRVTWTLMAAEVKHIV